ncbi:hypothetical protein [uncultured Aliiroseovarius sp.]|uniref:hypothetical protein n=2 Tax=Aliiroseovarius TaxID=1658781 RepID=UPI00259215E3|nr:hypothetical protein [uncultured Aliiroseovarius sp.]
MSNQLSDLSDLAKMRHDVAMSDLARHNRDIQELESRIADLRARLYTIPDTGFDDGLALSLISGHYDTWQRWAEQKLAKLNIQLARARAEKEAITTEARLAFGRKSATDALLDREKLAKHRAAIKRSELALSNNDPRKKSLFI